MKKSYTAFKILSATLITLLITGLLHRLAYFAFSMEKNGTGIPVQLGSVETILRVAAGKNPRYRSGSTDSGFDRRSRIFYFLREEKLKLPILYEIKTVLPQSAKTAGFYTFFCGKKLVKTAF